ncbi:Alpha/beta knot methyltransferase [Aspergillus karnatakaensis]|uniref:TrmH family RNA methyltransferase n=1 Tax=Aspergillus karnatakaensis TaxID=1810916 RepID=UPI003CCD43D8
MSLQSPFRTLRTSLRMPVAVGIPRTTFRYASLNTAIGRGIRRSQRLRDPRILAEKNRDRSRATDDPPETRNFRSARQRRKETEDFSGSADSGFENDKFVQRGSFRGLPREHQRSRQGHGSPAGKGRSSRYDLPPKPLTDRQKRRLEWKAKHDSEQAATGEIDEAEFIRTGSFRAKPQESRQRIDNEFKPRADRDFKGRADRESNETRSRAGRDLRATEERRPSPQRSSGRSERDTTPTSRKASDKKLGRAERAKEHVKAPDTIPYTTPASEFIYGTAAVEAALRCSKRQLYKLYLFQADEETLDYTRVVLHKLALAKNVKVKIVFNEWSRLLDKMSSGRPHNGCILEASPLPQTPVRALKPFEFEQDHFRLELSPQTREEALVNGTNDQIPMTISLVQQEPRYPVVLLLDGVVDTGNLGAIIRSAYYLGVDAVVFAGRNSAPLTPITIKASAGAAENMTLLTVKNEVEFIQKSKANGWRFYAADAPNMESSFYDPATLHARNLVPGGEGKPAQGLIGNAPSVIMMGNEGSGLSRHILSHADSIVSIPGARIIPGISPDPARVDSLNVSVAAALLMETFLRVPLGMSPVVKKEKEE